MIITDILSILAAITGSLAAIMTFYKKIIMPLIKAVTKVKDTINIIEKLQEEFKPNGGNSMRDAIARIEMRLLVEQQTRRVVSMALDVGIFECDASGMYLWVNQYYSNITGLTPLDAKNYGWVNAIDIKDRDAVVEEWNRAIAQKRAFQMEFRVINVLTGIPLKVVSHSFPIASDKGEIIGYVGIINRIN